MANPSSTSDTKGLRWAQEAADRSQDPVCGIGCALVDAQGLLVGTGSNFRGVHAEQAALHRCLNPHTAYIWPRPPCAECAKSLISAGVRRVVCRAPGERQLVRWRGSYWRALELLWRAEVEIVMVPRTRNAPAGDLS